VRPILGSLRSVPIPSRPLTDPQAVPQPFITISREPGVDTTELIDALLRALSQQTTGRDERPWSVWDGELVGKVAADHKLSSRLIESLEVTDRSWLTDLLTSLTYGDDADETKVYHRVAQTIRVLAQAGRVIIVGRGSVFITRDMPAGLHVRVVAPQNYRVLRVAHEHHLGAEAAAAHLRELERRRDAFHKRHWRKTSTDPDTFDVTLNAAHLDASVMAEAIVPLLRARALAGNAGKPDKAGQTR
jgi:cytidylate kinase